MRGKDNRAEMIIENKTGSPPLARERPRDLRFVMSLSRITPACAGKTSLIVKNGETVRDHPRLRGKDAKTQ